MFAPKLMAVSVRYSRSFEEAEDILQDSFFKIFTNLSEFEFQGSFEGWMKRVVINTALKMKQRKYYNSETIGISDINAETISPDIIETLTEEELIKIIGELPEGYRIVFNLHAIEGFSHKEISSILQIEESTSRSQLFKARKMLQDKVLNFYPNAAI
jgi:RNA polymerase sigma-70 factor (ECF subfamily)